MTNVCCCYAPVRRYVYASHHISHKGVIPGFSSRPNLIKTIFLQHSELHLVPTRFFSCTRTFTTTGLFQGAYVHQTHLIQCKQNISCSLVYQIFIKSCINQGISKRTTIPIRFHSTLQWRRSKTRRRAVKARFRERVKTKKYTYRIVSRGARHTLIHFPREIYKYRPRAGRLPRGKPRYIVKKKRQC